MTDHTCKNKTHSRFTVESLGPNFAKQTLDSFSMNPYIKPLQWNLAAMPSYESLLCFEFCLGHIHCVLGKAFMLACPLPFVQTWSSCSSHGIIFVCFNSCSKFIRKDEVRSIVWLFCQWVIRPQCCCSVRSSLWEAAVMHVCPLS